MTYFTTYLRGTSLLCRCPLGTDCQKAHSKDCFLSRTELFVPDCGVGLQVTCYHSHDFHDSRWYYSSWWRCAGCGACYAPTVLKCEGCAKRAAEQQLNGKEARYDPDPSLAHVGRGI
jgi:hypothetical protein